MGDNLAEAGQYHARVDSSALRRSIPNALTLARVALAVVFVALLSTTDFQHSSRYPSVLETGRGPMHWPMLLAAIVFVVAAVTDALDGYLARKWNAISRFGRVMDPFADKLLVLGAFVLLAGSGFWVPRSGADSSYSGPLQVSGVQAWMTVFILARELLVTSLRAALESSGVDFSATTSGKLKMVLQSVCVPAILLIISVGNPFAESSRQAIMGLVWTTVLITAWSGVPYILRAIRATPPA